MLRKAATFTFWFSLVPSVPYCRVDSGMIAQQGGRDLEYRATNRAGVGALGKAHPKGLLCYSQEGLLPAGLLQRLILFSIMAGSSVGFRSGEDSENARAAQGGVCAWEGKV